MKIILQFLLIVTIFVNCNNDDEIVLDLDPVFNLEVRDISNFGNALDFEISFTKPFDLLRIEEFRIFIVKSSKSLSFDSLTALGISGNALLSVGTEEVSKQINFSGSVTDVEGDPVTEGIPYKIFILSKAKEESLGGKLSKPSTEISLERKSAVRTLPNTINGGSGGMDTDASGNIYMADFGATLGSTPGTKVYKITPSGSVSIFANGFIGASGNDFDSDGNLFQSNISGGTISKITPSGQVSTYASEGIRGPVGVVYSDNGDLFVCNCWDNNIQKISPTKQSTVFATSTLFNCPNGIDIDAQGNLYVANFGNGSVLKINPDGNVSVFAIIPGGNNGHLLIKGPFIYVIGRGANKIFRVTFSGQVTSFAGNGVRGLGNGSLAQASFSLPNDLAFSPDGTKIYINDVASLSPDQSIISPVVIRVIDLVQ